MYQIDYRKRFAQCAVVALLACSAVARANDCAGGVDATGNDCTGEQVAPALSKAGSDALYLQGQVALAELRAARAKQRLIDGTAAVKAAQAEIRSAEAELRTTEAEVRKAHMALQANEQKQHHVDAKAR